MAGCVKSVNTIYRCGYAEFYFETDIYGDPYRRYANLISAELCQDFDGDHFRACSHLCRGDGCCNCERQQKQADEKYRDKQEVA